MVKVGTVSAVSANTARVFFPDTRMMSDWLHILRQTEEWTPEINDPVLCLYPDGFNADGYVLGVIAQ